MDKHKLIVLCLYLIILFSLISLGVYHISRNNACQKILEHSVFYERGDLTTNYSIEEIEISFTDRYFWQNMTGYYQNGNKSVYFQTSNHRRCENVWLH